MKKLMLLIAIAALTLSSSVMAGTMVSGNITEDTHWTKADHPYHLDGLVKVMPGATLTIDKGVVVASFKSDEGSLAILRGAKIFVNGTKEEPVIMTSAEDVATWDGSDVTYDGGIIPEVIAINTLGDPKTGTWRASCLEWGSLAILGNGYISASHYEEQPVTWDKDDDGIPGGSYTTYTNSKDPNGLNKKIMEGLDTEFTGDTSVLYGGDDDNDCSGSISYLSLRYGGKVIGKNNELNGMSLGAVGRGTDVHHVEIMNNVDDGIELWGGTVELDHVNIWNIGDDSLDFDEGWRGSAKYGLIVQGYSQVEDQGSGVGDNCFEHDGAEDADAQPVTTVRIENFTAVGQPGTSTNAGGDAGTAWRDNARVQYDKCVWVDLDDHIVKFDNADKDGAAGYDGTAGLDDSGDKLTSNTPADGTMNWDQHWTTSYNNWITSGYQDPVGFGFDSAYFDAIYGTYMTQDPTGMLCQITNSVVYGDNVKYDEYDRLAGIGANFSGNVKDASVMPIQSLQRAAVVTVNGPEDTLDIAPVTSINPLPAGDAVALNAGGFVEGNNWLKGWTATDAFGFTDTSMNDLSADTDGSGSVDFIDLAQLGDEWLQD